MSFASIPYSGWDLSLHIKGVCPKMSSKRSCRMNLSKFRNILTLIWEYRAGITEGLPQQPLTLPPTRATCATVDVMGSATILSCMTPG